MAQIVINPSERSFTENPLRDDINRFQRRLFRGEIRIPYNQVNEIQQALSGMAEKAPEGLAEGTNRAAEHTRERLVDTLKERFTLDPQRIEAAVYIDARARPEAPAARIRVTYHREPLVGFEHWQDSAGTYARQDRTQAPRRVPASFVGAMRSGHRGVFQRVKRGGARVGRLPIKEKTGQSVQSMVEDTPGLVDETTAFARAQLVKQVSDVRDEIVDVFTDESNAFRMLAPTTSGAVGSLLLPFGIARVAVAGIGRLFR